MMIKILFRLVIIFMICLGAHAWFVWNIETLEKLPQLIIYFFLCVIAFIYKKKNGIVFKKQGVLVLIIISFVTAGFFPISDIFSLLTDVALSLLAIYPIIVLLCDQQNASSHLRVISVFFAVLFIPGLIIWYYTSFIVTIPGIPIVYPNDNDTYIFYNYLFSLKNMYWDDYFHRFMSVFLEAGYLGTFLSFLLYANQYNLSKWYNIILLISLLASFSLAGYLMALFGYLFLRFKEKKTGVLILSAFIIVVMYFIGITYNNGDNIINHTVIERLAFDPDKGIAGNDRFLGSTDYIYERYASSGNLLFGNLGAWKELDIAGAGYKIYFICYGIISALLYLLFYFLVVKYTNSRQYGLFFIVLIILCFLQAAYPDSLSWIIPFVLGVVAYTSPKGSSC